MKLNISNAFTGARMPFSYENTLICGDNGPYLTECPPESVALIGTDPPYNIGFDYDGEYDDKRDVADYLDWCRFWMSHCYRILMPTGSFWCAIGPAMVSELDVIAKSLGFRKRNHIIWHYTFGVNCEKKFTPSSTHLLYYTKRREGFTFNTEGNKVPSARQLVYNDGRASKDGRLPDDVWCLRPHWMPAAFDPAGDLWYNPRVAGTFKERQRGIKNQMPEQVMARIIRVCSNEGDLVMDPFAGSATTLATAKKLGRRYTGCELSKTFHMIAQGRLAGVNPGDPIAGNPDPFTDPTTPRAKHAD